MLGVVDLLSAPHSLPINEPHKLQTQELLICYALQGVNHVEQRVYAPPRARPPIPQQVPILPRLALFHDFGKDQDSLVFNHEGRYKRGVKIESNVQVNGVVNQGSSITLKENVAQLSGQEVAAYNLLKVPNQIANDSLFVTHTFTEPGTYTVEATAKSIGRDGYTGVTQAMIVEADPKPAPSPTPPAPQPQPLSVKICAGETVPDGYIVINDGVEPVLLRETNNHHVQCMHIIDLIRLRPRLLRNFRQHG